MYMKNIYKSLLVFSCLLIVSMRISAQETLSSNVAYKDNNVRFTVITGGTVRLEWSPDGKFVDNSSFIAVNRKYPAVNYRIKNRKGYVEITTDKLVLRYTKNSGKFTAKNLKITSIKGLYPFKWVPGMENTGNLKGTYRTLDGCNGVDKNRNGMKLEDGLLSTEGWTLLDDSKGYLFDNADWPWVENRSENDGQDWYFMAYGHNYKSALKDFTVFAGKEPLPPRFAFGYWWSRYWSYSDNEIRELLNNFHTYDIPLDVLVIDMDWHYTEPGKGGWTGYTWNRRLFPDPEGLLRYIRNNGLQVTLNLHPADGVASYETNFPAMAKWMGVNPDTTKVIPYEGSNKQFMSGWLNTLLRPMEKEGVSFWWLDWQQRLNDKKYKDLSNTWWLNYVMFSDMERNRNTRPLLYHRWGGLGNHRYQIGFSGDAIICWDMLKYEPYFNSTASNVLYGYWSHDIGGHYGADSINPELYTRWLQFGALSAILRTHSTKNANLNKEPWTFDHKYFDIIRNTILQRYEMAPYIYTMARKAYDTGVSLCRPMYYDYPDDKEAYDNKDEYMFGDNVLVYPITSPMKDDKSEVKVWLPKGNDWYEWDTGTLLKGGQTVERSFHIDEYPIYIKAGSILPFYGKVKSLESNDDSVTVMVSPGNEGKFIMYEDNGDDKDYATNYATTELSSKKEGNVLTVQIGARKGSYEGMPLNRKYKVRVECSAVPEKVTVNGEKTDYTYDGLNLSLTIDIPQTGCAGKKEVKITYPTDVPELADGLKGDFHHICQATLELKKFNAGIVLNESLGTMESTGRAITYYPEEFNKRIEAFRKNYTELPNILKSEKLSEKAQAWFLNYVLYKKEPKIIKDK